MGHGYRASYQVTMASGATLTSEINLGRSFAKTYLAVPSMTSNTQIFIKASDISGGNFCRVKALVFNTATVAAPSDFSVASSATNCFVIIPNALQYIKIETTATVDNGLTFKVLCNDADTNTSRPGVGAVMTSAESVSSINNVSWAT